MFLIFVTFIFLSNFTLIYGIPCHCFNTTGYKNLFDSNEIGECIERDCSMDISECDKYSNMVKVVKSYCPNFTSIPSELPKNIEMVVLSNSRINELELDTIEKFKYIVLNQSELTLKAIKLNVKGTIIKIIKDKNEIIISHTNTFDDILNNTKYIHDNVILIISLSFNAIQALTIISILTCCIFFKRQAQNSRKITYNIEEAHYRRPHDQKQEFCYSRSDINHVYDEPVNSLRISNTNDNNY
ncbi:hypothetical protein PVAND_017581 [Polypedilum vanderplanki]|uniref:Uncharacterized protein n=1 Tax=Polypedilum vanderplanki TaxID=319348 RepID=A0A9J6BJG4_POLVA|nr:hypothetical protein PVAND_017581 [Polypedilum vanderplanki]